jgi:hypothetical protein
MEVLWIVCGTFALLVGITKSVEYVNRKKAYKRALKISRGNQ